MKTVFHVLMTGSFSGAENVVITYIGRLDGTKYRNIYVSKKGSIQAYLEEAKIEHELVKVVTPIQLYRLIKKYKPDVIHAHDFLASVFCVCATRKSKIVSHLHNNPPWLSTKNLFSFLYKLSARYYSKILAVSKSVFEEYIYQDAIQSKSIVMSNPIDIENMNAYRDSGIEKKFDVLYLGRLANPKCPVRFIEIIDEVRKKQANIRTAMGGDGELKDACLNKIQKCHLEDNVQMLGFVSEKYKLIQQSKVLCVPSKWEGFGLVAVEALAMGVPVVATPVGGLPDILTKDCGVLCNTNEEFASAIDKLLTDETFYQSKSAAAFRRAKELDNMQEYIETLQKIYEM